MFFKSKPAALPEVPVAPVAPVVPRPVIQTDASPAVPLSTRLPTPTPAAIARLSDLDRKLSEVIKRLGRIEANLIDIRQGWMRGEREIN